MDAKANSYIMQQPADRQGIMKAIHTIILEEDKTVVPVVEQMMRAEMIVYKDRGSMKYALAGGKGYMSLHVLPIYMSGKLSPKYQALLPDAKFQKGCINFTRAEQVPLDIIRQLMADCSKIDLVKMREDQLKAKKKKTH